MDQENETAVEAHIVDNGGGESVVVDLPSNEGEGGNTVETEATRIEEIRAETTIAVAAIEADVETARIEADAEREQKWLEEKAALETSLQELKNELSRLTEQLAPSIQTPLAEAAETAAEVATEIVEELALEEPPAIVEEQNSIQEFTPDQTSSTEAGSSPNVEEESAVVAAVAIAVPPRAKRRAI